MKRRLLLAAKFVVPILALIVGWLWWVDHKAGQIWITGPTITEAGFAHLRDLVNLESLTLFDTCPGQAGLRHLQGMTRLKFLVLGGQAVTDAELEQLQGLTGLRSLSLYRTRETDEGVEKLKRVLPGLRVRRDPREPEADQK